MSLLRRHRWFVAAAGITLAFTVVSLTAHRGPALTAFADLIEWALPIGLLVALFATFVGVALSTMFGGDEHVLRTTGLT